MLKLFARGTLVALLTGIAFAAPLPALAAGEADRIEYLNKKAMEDYDSLEFESARRTLVDCVAKLRSAGLDQSALAAKTYMHLGVVYIAGFHDKGRGQQQFERALKIDPTLKLDAALATPELQEAWDAAFASLPKKKREKAAQGGEPAGQAGQNGQTGQGGQTGQSPSGKPEPAPEPPKAETLQHSPLDELPQGEKAYIYAKPLSTIGKAILYCRGPGEEVYRQIPMGRSRKRPDEIVGQCPAETVSGRSFQYYLEAYDGAGQVVGKQGSAESPFIVTVAGGKGRPTPSGEDREDPLAEVRRQKELERAGKPHRDWVYFDVGFSPGLFGIIPPGTTTEVAWYYDRASKLYKPAVASSGGLVFAGLALRAEVGVYAYKGLSLGFSGLAELYLNNNAESTDTPKVCTKSDNTMSNCYATTSKGFGGFIGLVKARYQFRQNSVFRPYVHVDVGGGVWRGALNIDGSKPMTGNTVDPTSPLQPTDVCSATYNGQTGSGREPEGCSSVGQVPGYNRQDPKPTAPNLNRACPVDGPCIDAVLMGKGALGGGGGFYVGGKHVGFTADFTILGLFGGDQSGAIFDISLGPQFIF